MILQVLQETSGIPTGEEGHNTFLPTTVPAPYKLKKEGKEKEKETNPLDALLYYWRIHFFPFLGADVIYKCWNLAQKPFVIFITISLTFSNRSSLNPPISSPPPPPPPPSFFVSFLPSLPILNRQVR